MRTDPFGEKDAVGGYFDGVGVVIVYVLTVRLYDGPFADGGCDVLFKIRRPGFVASRLPWTTRGGIEGVLARTTFRVQSNPQGGPPPS